MKTIQEFRESKSIISPDHYIYITVYPFIFKVNFYIKGNTVSSEMTEFSFLAGTEESRVLNKSTFFSTFFDDYYHDMLDKIQTSSEYRNIRAEIYSHDQVVAEMDFIGGMLKQVRKDKNIKDIRKALQDRINQRSK